MNEDKIIDLLSWLALAAYTGLKPPQKIHETNDQNGSFSTSKP